MSNNQSESSKGDQSQELHHDNQEHDIQQNTTIVNKNYQVSDESSQSEIQVETQPTKVTKYVKEEKPQYEDQRAKLKSMNQRMLQIPSVFPQNPNEAKSVNNVPYLKQYFQKQIKNGQIAIKGQKLVTENNIALQREVSQISSQPLEYAQFMDQGIQAEFLAQQIELQQNMVTLKSQMVMFRTKNEQEYDVFFRWDNNKRLQSNIITVGTQVSLLVFSDNKEIHRLNGKVQEGNNMMMIQLENTPCQECISTVLHDNSTQLDLKNKPKKLSKEAGNDLDILFDRYFVYGAQDQISYKFTLDSNDYLKKLMLDSVKFVSKSELLNMQVLKGIDVKNNMVKASKLIPNRDQIDYIMRSVNAKLTEQNLNIPNDHQAMAIKQSLTNSISLIQGCPGGGKTYTSIVLAQCLLQLYPGKKVLCCAGSNTASDNLTLYCRKLNLNVIRVYAKSKEGVEDTSIPKEVQDVRAKTNFYRQTEEENYGLANYFTNRRNKTIKKLYERIENQIIDSTDIVICTCASSNLGKIKGIKFSSLILDESSQLLEAESIIPISFVPNHFILVGDQKQLGPTIINKDSERSNYGRSLYQRLFELGIKPIQLSQQYRMHPGLLEFSNKQFYDSIIKSEVSSEQRSLVPVIKKGLKQKLQTDFPSFFWHVKGQENRHEKSFKNQKEADAVVTFIYSVMMEYGIKQEQIGVITPYSGQQFLIQSMLKELPLIEVNSVDGFQGREKDVIIFSTVRSNDTGTIGFLHQKNRVNVAFTRARNMFFIIGDYKQLNEKPGIWRDIVKFYMKKGALFQGDTLKKLTKVQ